MPTCIVCKVTYTGNNHHCDPKREAKIEAGRKSHGDYREYRPSYSARLNAGFNLLRRSDDSYEQE